MVVGFSTGAVGELVVVVVVVVIVVAAINSMAFCLLFGVSRAQGWLLACRKIPWKAPVIASIFLPKLPFPWNRSCPVDDDDFCTFLKQERREKREEEEEKKKTASLPMTLSKRAYSEVLLPSPRTKINFVFRPRVHNRFTIEEFHAARDCSRW